VKTIFQEKLISVLLYGSYVEGNFNRKNSDINVLIVLSQVGFSDIEEFGKACKGLIRKYNITPLILRKREFINSADVFPMEYIDLSERHACIYGEDVTKELTLTNENLRHQLEFLLRGSVNSLRQLIASSPGKYRVLGKNLKNLFGPYIGLFRGVLRLRGVTPVPHDAKEVLRKISSEFSQSEVESTKLIFDNSPFLELIKYRNGEKKDPKQLGIEILKELQDLVTMVDAMDEGK
jgi:predicted nucleotidyltransferase